MHSLVTVTDDHVAIPMFGLNAGSQRGMLMITARSGSDTAQVSVLESAPTGQLQSDQSIADPVNIDELAVLSTVMPAESGFVCDGFMLAQLAYLAVKVTGTTYLDVSFVENRMPVDIGKPGGLL